MSRKPSLIDIDRLVVKYRERVAVEDLSLVVPAWNHHRRDRSKWCWQDQPDPGCQRGIAHPFRDDHPVW